MIETNNIEINIDELMGKVREEIAGRKSTFMSQENEQYRAGTGKEEVVVSNIEALINNAEFKAQARTDWPKKFNRFPFNLGWLQKFILKAYNFLLKEQRVVNFSLSQALRESLTLNRDLSEQVAALQVQLNEISDRLNVINERVDQLLSATDEQVNHISDRLNVTNERVNQLLSATDTRLTAIDDRYIRNDSYLKNDLAQQKRLIALFLEEAQQRLPKPFSQEHLQTFVDEHQHLLDAFYVAFEDRFRGKREEITGKLKVYLPIIAEAKIGTPDSPILDVGCGRGEWLELMLENGYAVKGIDINRVMVEQCKAKGFEVIEADVIAYLQSLPDTSLGAVTGFHIIEHLQFPLLLKLFSEVVRVLQPNGLAIFETPNPQNLLVGACDFYSDPTHHHPLYPETIQFLLSYQGLFNVQLLYLNSVEISSFDKQDLESQTLHKWFFGPRDYAVVGYKV
jgi:O-antigen chain-terminating methyltransferase